MTERARTTTAALLCVAVVGALVLIVMAFRAPDSAFEPFEVSLDFDTFAPGVIQSRSTVVDVPVRSRVIEAGAVASSGLASDIDWSFELCQGATCVPLTRDSTVESGAYRVQVSALLAADTSTEPGASGRVFGRVQFGESLTSSDGRSGESTVVWWAAIGGMLVTIGVMLGRHRMVTT